MGVIQLSDKLQQIIDRQVADRYATPSAFLEEGVMRLVDDASIEAEEIRQAVQAGIADVNAGRYTTIATAEDERRLQDRLTARLRASLAAEE